MSSATLTDLFGQATLDERPPRFDLVFRGQDGTECERFIMAIKKEALAQGKLRDDDWIVGLVETHMEGTALRWFETLDDATQYNWKLLKQALLARYPAEPSEP